MTLASFISSDRRSLYFLQALPDSGSDAACTPITHFTRVDLPELSLTRGTLPFSRHILPSFGGNVGCFAKSMHVALRKGGVRLQQR